MIRALCFDLDGTLLNTEWLKCVSYAEAIREIDPSVPVAAVEREFREVVGRSREYVCAHLVRAFNLEEKARHFFKKEKKKDAPGVLAAVRARHYERIIGDKKTVMDARWPYTIELVKLAQEAVCGLALATMSHRPQVEVILEALGLSETFTHVFTREDIENPKPDPEIYLLAAAELGVEPVECLVIEDSASGVESAVKAGMHCIAVATDMTRDGLHKSLHLKPELLVEDPTQLLRAVESVYARENNGPMGSVAAVCDIPKVRRKKVGGNC